MKTSIAVLINILILNSFTVFSQNDSIYTFGEDPGEVEYFFGFNLIPSTMGGMIHLALVKPGGTKNIIKQITKEDFVAQASGKQLSWANPKSTNLFKKYQIDNPNVIDDLWRLRYKEYPYFSNEKMEPGWSANTDSISELPSKAQMQMLEKFGLYRISDYIYGENAFKILYLMTKPEWIKTYKESY